ncbi:MAG: right-handed parallel beta-helix repeat-containing protein [Lentisphaeria bacterium]|nr:right-handed parallel beta-helix repeat-containing protein [Lentisphaeria bacterium]
MCSRTFLCSAALLTCLPLAAATNYYVTPERRTGTIGETAGGSELHRKALFSEFCGSSQEIGGEKLPAMVANGETSVLIWKFTRAEGDGKAYEVKIDARFYVEPAAVAGGSGAPRLSVGFEDFRGERYADNYFISDDSAAGLIAAGEKKEGAQILANGESLVVPAGQKEFYVILSAPTANMSGALYGRVESLAVKFTPLELPAGDEAECPYWAAPAGIRRNVVEFGADPAGVGDSAPAIQKALDLGGDIVIPPGTYRLDSTLMIRKSNTTLRGEGGPVLIRKRIEGTDPKKNDYSYIRTARFPGIRLLRNIRISGLRLLTPGWDRPQIDNWSKGIELFGVRDSVVEGCEVRLPAHDGITLVCTANTAVRDCVTFGARHGISAGGNFRGRGSFHTQIVNNRVSRAWDTGIVVGILTDDVLVSGNLIRESGSHAVDIFNCRNVTVTGNAIRNWVLPGLNPYPGNFRQAVGIFVHTDWGLLRDMPTENITVAGNTLVCDYPFVLPLDQQPGEKREAGVYYSPICVQITGDFVRNVTVSGNTLTGGAKGIYISALEPKEMDSARPLDGTPQNLTIVGNTVTGQKFTAFECSGNGTRMRGIVTGNLFADYPEGGWKPGDTGLVESGNIRR